MLRNERRYFFVYGCKWQDTLAHENNEALQKLVVVLSLVPKKVRNKQIWSIKTKVFLGTFARLVNEKQRRPQCEENIVRRQPFINSLGREFLTPKFTDPQNFFFMENIYNI